MATAPPFLARQAIGLVLNLTLDPAEPRTKDPNMRSFTVRPFDEVGKKLSASGIGFEFAGTDCF